MVQVREDLTKMVFGRLTVLYQIEDYISPKGKHEAQWLCECSCEDHTIITVIGHSLKCGVTTSCGCISRELSANRLRKYNKYDLSREYGIGWTTNTNQPFFFDLEDYDKIKDYCWSEYVCDHGYHSLRSGTSGKNIHFQWLVFGKGADHKNRNPLDNRKSNLRMANTTENARNHNKQKNNTSGVIGVSWDKQKEQWRSYITINKRKKHIGYYDDKESAIIARLYAELKYFGDFAPQQDLFEEYNIKS